MSLNLTNFRTVLNDDFTQDTSLNSALWAVSFGNADQFSFSNTGLTLTGYQSENWNPVGFLQLDNSKSAGEGYGLYQFTGYVNAGQGAGICFIMWRADDTYLDASTPDKATEIDVLESWNGSKNGFSNLHYYDTGHGWSYNDGQSLTTLSGSINLAQTHTYAVDWERGSLTFYVDGNEIYQNTTNVPLDYADGGSNEVMGAEVEGETAYVTSPTVQLHIIAMSYSEPVTTSTVTTVSSSVTLNGGAQAYSAAAGTSVQAGADNDTVTAAAGGVNVTDGYGTLLFFGGSSPSQVTGGVGSETIFGGTGGGSYSGGSNGHNVLVSQGASGANTTLRGGAAGDQLFGSAQGNDDLVAAVGRESILGGSGNTTIVGGGTAASVIFTGGGSSLVYGGDAGGDTIVGGTGAMDVIAQNGDAVFGNGGALDVSGSTTGADSIIGGAGPLLVAGRGGNMLVVAGTSTSQIQVGNGASLIFTGTGQTTVAGGTGWMECVLGSGATTIYEGGGPSIYEVVKGAAGGTDLINNFNPTADRISLYGYQASDIHVARSGSMTTLTLSDGTKLELPGVTNLGNSVN